MKKFIIIGILGTFGSCKDSKSLLPNTPKDAAIYYWQLANEGMKGDTAKYRLYRQGYLQDSVGRLSAINKDIFGGLLIYETAKTTHKGTIKTFENVGEKIIEKNSFGRKIEVDEKLIFTYQDGSADTIVTRLMLENKVWKMKWQKEEDFFTKNKRNAARRNAAQ